MPDISKITLPSGTTYDIKDETARQMISGGVAFNIVWTQANYSMNFPEPGMEDAIPAGVKAYYKNGANYITGTLAASAQLVGQFYLVYDNTEDRNLYDEYVVINSSGTYSWEKIGDTSVDLDGLVTDVTTTSASFVKSIGTATKDNVIGADATFTVTQPTITVTPSQTYLSASASGGGTAWNSKDSKQVLTGYSNPSTATVSKATADTSQTTATGSGTASSTNTDWLKGVSVSNETLTIGAATMNTQSTTQFTFTDVSVIQGLGTASTTNVIGANSTFTNTQPTVSLATNSATATGRVQVATGISSATATGGNVAWNSKDTVSAVTNVGTATTGNAITSVTAVKE